MDQTIETLQREWDAAERRYQTIEALEREWDAAVRLYNRACNPYYNAVTMAPMRDSAIATMDWIEALVATMPTEDQDRFYGRS